MHPLGVLDSGGKATEVIIDRDTRYGINAYDYFVYKIGRSPKPTEKVHFIVATDILIVGESPEKPAIHFDNRWTANNRITLTNYGFILGKGGKAGKGARVDWQRVFGGNTPHYSSGFIVENATAGGNGGVAILNGEKKRNTVTSNITLVQNGLKLKVFNHKLISSGGGGGGGSGAWRTAMQHSVPQENRLVSKTGAVLNQFSINGSFGGGSSGSGGAPLGEWVPHNATIDDERKKYALGSREDRLLVSMRNYEPHRKWGYGVDTFTGVGSFSTELGLYSTFTQMRIDRLLYTFSMDEYTNMIRKMGKYTGVDNRDVRWDKPFQAYEVKVNNDNTASFTFLMDKVDPDLINLAGKALDADRFAKNQTHPIYPEDKEFFENIKMRNPYFNLASRYGTVVNTYGSRIAPPYGGNKQSQLKGGSNFGLIPYYAPPAKTGLVNGGFTGMSSGEQYTNVNWSRNHSVEDEYTVATFSTINFLATGSTASVTITPYIIKASVLITDGAGKVVPYLRERDYYKGGRGGYLGSDGEAGTLNKMYLFEDLQRNGNNYNIPTYLLDKTRIAPPAPGGKAGLITEGDVAIENMPTGIMRGYTSGSNKVEQPLTPSITSSLDKKFVKPVNRIVPFSHSFVPGFDPYDWECEIGVLPKDGLGGAPIKHQLATKKLGFETYVLTKNLALDIGIKPTFKPGEIRVVIPAGYMTYSHIPGVNEWVKKHNFSSQALQLATILTYLVETFKTLHVPLSINEVGVFHLIPPHQIDDALRYQNSFSNAVSASALSELIALRINHMSANVLGSLNLSGVPTRVVNGETQYLIGEYEVYASLRIRNGSITDRTIKSTLISQTSIAPSFNLPLFNGHNGDYVGRITLPRNIDIELMPSNPSYVVLIYKTDEYKYEIPNHANGTGTRRVRYWAKSVMPVDHCIVDTEKQKLIRDAIEWYRQTGKWE